MSASISNTWRIRSPYEAIEVLLNARDAEGNLLSTYNPNSRWDWYTVGGRFPGRLKAKSGKHGEGSAYADNPRADGAFDEARVGDVDFSPDPDRYAAAA